MQYDENTPRKDITVAKVVLSAIAPYAEGHTLSASEANVLNQTLAENLRNNFAAYVKKATEEAGSVDALDLNKLQDDFDEYQTEYDFGVRRGGGGSRASVDPIEREATKLAVAAVKRHLKAKNIKLDDISDEQFDEYVAKVAASDKILAIAKENVAQKQALASTVIDLDVEAAA